MYLPKSTVEQAGKHESHETGQEEEFVAYVERHDLVDLRDVSEFPGIAVGVHGKYHHANDPGQAEQTYHQRNGQPQCPKKTLRILEICPNRNT